jgi:hypothetical protein
LKIIKFYARKIHRENGVPVPTKRTIPEWFKNAESTYTARDGSQAAGLKKCMPYVDIMMSGYVLTLPVDVYVSKDENNDLDIKWEEKEGYKNFIAERPAGSHNATPTRLRSKPPCLFWKLGMENS